MILQRYGIQLCLINHSDIELLRKMRNREDIRQHMIYRNYISREQQEQWFNQINNVRNHYFIIRYNRRKVGLINVKDIDYSGTYNESGLFIWDRSLLSGHVPSLASIVMSEAGYTILGGSKSSVKVLSENRAALSFNKSLGYEIISETNGIAIMEQTRDSFSMTTKLLRDNLSKQHESYKYLELKFGRLARDQEMKDHFLNFYIKNLDILAEKHTSETDVYRIIIDF